MSDVNKGSSSRRASIALAIVLGLVVAGFSIYYYQSQTTIGNLDARGTFNQSVILLPTTNVTLRACAPNSCAGSLTWQWNFPYNKSLQSPGYLNVTVYRSNNTGGYLVANWSYNNSEGRGFQSWDYSTGSYPRTSPGWMILPVLKGMIDLTIFLQPQPHFASWQTISISYYY